MQLLLETNLIRPASSTPSSLALGRLSRCERSKSRARRCLFRHSANPYFSPTSDRRREHFRSLNGSNKRAYMPTFSRFGILLRLRRPHEPSSRPPGRPSPGEVEAGGHGSGRSKRKGPPRVEKRTSKRGKHSEFQSLDDTTLGILHIYTSWFKVNDGNNQSRMPLAIIFTRISPIWHHSDRHEQRKRVTQPVL